MNPLAIKAIAVAVVLAIVAGAGWTVNGWRLAGQLEQLQGVVDTQKQSLATLAGANERCAAGVADVKGAVKALVDDGTRRSAAAAAAMEQVAARAKGHLDGAAAALNRAMPAAGQECDTAAAEALDYAKRRKAAP